eukprot:gene4285-5467_t
MAWRVVDAKHAFDHAVSKGAVPYSGTDKCLDVPAIVGIGGSLLYFVETYGAKGSAYEAEFEWTGDRNPKPEGVGFYYLDHLTHNVYRGNMDKWWAFYRELFNFTQIHFFDIDGRITGLVSRAITSPCGKIRIPLNESKDDTSQIEEYLRKYKGEGIQHIAVGTDGIYDATDRLAANDLKFMPGPPETYYDMSHERVHGHDEPIERMKKHGILIDGEGVVRRIWRKVKVAGHVDEVQEALKRANGLAQTQMQDLVAPDHDRELAIAARLARSPAS